MRGDQIMRLTCPCCGATYSIEVLLADKSARAAVASAFSLPASLGDRVLRYIGLFRPKTRALSWGRAERLIAEIAEMVNAAQITRDGQIYPAPVESWKAALDQMLDNRDRLILPMDGHGYLLAILVGQHQKATEKQLARQEIADEQAKTRQGERWGTAQNAGVVVQPKPEPEKRSTGVPPPAEFHRLINELRGKMMVGGES